MHWRNSGWAYKPWWEVYFDLFRGYHIAASVGTSVIVFSVGIAISWPIGFHGDYVSTQAVYLGVFGIAWVGGWLGWASHRLRSLLGQIRHAFVVTDEAFERVSSRWLRRMFDYRLSIGLSSVLIAGTWAYVPLATRWFGGLPWFPAVWSTGPQLWAKNLILCVYAVPIILLVVSGAVAIVAFAALVFDVGRLRYVSLLEVTRLRLRPLADFGLHVGYAWSIGVLLFVVLFRPEFTPASIAGISLLTLLGLLTLLWPQWVLHRGLAQLRRELLDSAAGLLEEELLTKSDYSSDDFVRKMVKPSAQRMDAFIRSTIGNRTWVYDPGELTRFVGQLLIPLVSLLLTAVVRTQGGTSP